MNAESYNNPANHISPSCSGSESVTNQEEYPQFIEGDPTQPTFSPPDSSLAFISTPPPSLTQVYLKILCIGPFSNKRLMITGKSDKEF